MIRIITDSTSGMLQEEASRLGIKIVPCTLIWDGKEYLDGVDMSTEEFYERLSSSGTLPTSSLPAPSQFAEAYEEAKAAGEDVLAILISSRLSGAYQSACKAKKLVQGVRIEVIDTFNTIMGERILLEQAAARRDRPLDEVKSFIEGLIPRIRSWGVMDTLKYLHKGGRLSGGAAVVGSILQIKPVVAVEGGEIRLKCKTIGNRKAMRQIAELMKKYPVDRSFPMCYAYAAKTTKCELLMEAIGVDKETVQDRIFPISPVIGTYVGPDACLVSYVQAE